MSLACLLTPVAILVSGFLAWLYHRKISALRATLDFVSRTEVGNPGWRETRSLFIRLASDDGQGLLDLVSPKGPSQIDEAVKVALYLSHCEFVAVAIQEGAMDEKMYKKWQRTNYVTTWRDAEAYITARRKNKSHPSMYENFEALAKKWSQG